MNMEFVEILYASNEKNSLKHLILLAQRIDLPAKAFFYYLKILIFLKVSHLI